MGSGAERSIDKEEATSRSNHSAEQVRVLGAEESTEKPVDDLTELLARAAMLQSQYREFESGPRAPAEPARPIPASDSSRDQAGHPAKEPAQGPIRWRARVEKAEPKDLSRVSGRDIPASDYYDPATGVLIRREEAATLPRRDATESQEPTRPSRANEQNGRKQFNSSARWSVLGEVLSTEGDAADERLIRSLGASISIPFQFAASVSGGAGVTTILATIARCLATHGEHLLVADPGASSLLPLYFGSSNAGEGELQSFLMPDSDAGVSIVNSRQSSARLSSRFHVESESRRNLIATIRKAAAHSDRLLLDAGALRASDVQSLRRKTHFALMPLVPDVSCVLGLMRLEESLQSLDGNGDPSGALYYVLNKFDSSLALHRDIRASLEQKVGVRLAPVTIRRSDAVPEALADGMTVIDYCPDAGVAEDFLRLAEWLRRMAPTGRVDRAESQ